MLIAAKHFELTSAPSSGRTIASFAVIPVAENEHTIALITTYHIHVQL